MLGPTEIAKIFNAAGVTVILGVSLLVGSRHPSRFFKMWAHAYLGGWLALGLAAATSYLGNPPWLVMLQVGLVTTVVWYFVQAGRAVERELLPASWFAIMLALAMVAASVLFALQLPFQAVLGPFVVVYALAHIWLGWQVVRSRRELKLGGARLLGGSLAASGLWFFSYPVLENGPYAWFGYLVSSLLNLLVGSGLIVFMIEDTARQLREKNQELTRLDALKNMFISTMSHELRTPLTSIKTASWLMANRTPEPLTTTQAGLVQTISEQSEHLEQLVSDVLDHAQISSGTMQYDKQEEDFGEIAEACVAAMRPVLEEKGLTLQLEGAEQPLPIHADRRRIFQVLFNLLSNANKFTPAGGAVTARIWAEGGDACFELADTGIGIPPEHLARIFERFYQVDPSSRRKYGGMGLGLALARSIVEEGHQGTLRAFSEPGRGSRFVVRLPAAMAASDLATIASRIKSP